MHPEYPYPKGLLSWTKDPDLLDLLCQYWDRRAAQWLSEKDFPFGTVEYEANRVQMHKDLDNLASLIALKDPSTDPLAF